MPPFRWTADHISRIAAGDHVFAPVIGANRINRILPGVDLWDHWPVLDAAGSLFEIGGGLLVVALSAPILPNPEDRHAVARLRLLHRRADGWHDLGDLLPDGLSPGSREWAGSAIVDPATSRLTLYFTAAGQRGENVLSFEQRLFVTEADIEVGNGISLGRWTRPREIVTPDGKDYLTDMAGGGTPGTIKAFRDPYLVQLPGVSGDSILFSASRARTAEGWNAVIGRACRNAAGEWTLRPPIIDATGINNELERPHVILHAGRIYLFWSTHAHVFAPGVVAPTGLYGVVADSMDGAWRPLNGHGLVFANPPEAPAQAYSWQVLPTLEIWGFANFVGLDHAPRTIAEARQSFAGTPSPPLRLIIEDDRATLEHRR